MKKSVLGTVGILVDDNYKWKDTLIIDENMATEDEETYQNCKQYIEIIYTKEIDYSKARKIDGDIYGCEEYVYDDEKKTKIYFKKQNICVIETNQEANEWLMMILTLLLLKEGYSIIHAAAVSTPKGALVLPSWGGVGKTASIAKLIKEGYQLLGDDMNIITKEGEIYPLPKKFVLYFYHKELFPEVFKEKGPKCKKKMDIFYEKVKPFIKKLLRHIPSVLAYMRKHNPQSIRVSPTEIFGKEVIGKKTNINQVIWIERNQGTNGYKEISYEEISSKATAVTLNEIFGHNLQAILIMCGFYQIDIKEIFGKMNDIYEQAFSQAITGVLNVSPKEEVSKVADEVIKNMK